MKARSIWGLVVALFGLVLCVPSFIWEISHVTLYYGIPFFIVGLIISFNKREDKIEEINYRGVKKNVRK
ncbi:hypothetical protein HOD29_01085 [archaeon]|jgi:hypothetical protein|nr:hypothetical protein [archaeon]